jgi:glycosyltransferase involved in cell wall biosynthesis
VATNDASDDATAAGGNIDRVLWFSHSSSLAGAELGLHEAVSALRRRGIESIVVVPNDGPLAARLRDDGVAVLVQPYRWWVSLGPSRDGRLKNILAIFDLRRIRRLAALIKSTGADAVVTNTITIGLPALAARSAGVGNVWYVREYGRDDHSLEFDLGDRLAYWLIDRLSSAVIVNSLALQAHLLEHGINRAELVSYAVDVPDGYAQPPPSGETLELVLVGAVKPGKGHEDAVRALAGALEQGTRARLTFVGPTLPAFGEKIAELAGDLGVREHIRFTGFLNNPFEEIAAADVCLVCSRREAFGRATVEAMKCARAVVGAASGATAELIEDGVTGLLYEPGDVAGLRDAVVRLDRDRDLVRRLGENARIWASAQFTVERYAADLERIVSRVCGETRGANAKRRTASPGQPSAERPR